MAPEGRSQSLECPGHQDPHPQPVPPAPLRPAPSITTAGEGRLGLLGWALTHPIPAPHLMRRDLLIRHWIGPVPGLLPGLLVSPKQPRSSVATIWGAPLKARYTGSDFMHHSGAHVYRRLPVLFPQMTMPRCDKSHLSIIEFNVAFL